MSSAISIDESSAALIAAEDEHVAQHPHHRGPADGR